MTIRRLLALFGLFAGLLGATFLLAGPASAHATVVASSPADGARLPHAPHAVSITFDESVGLGSVGYLHVTDQSGKRVDARPAYHPGGNDTKVVDQLAGGLGEGTYTASYRVVSADSHPIAGTIRFVVGNGALAPASAPSGAAVNSTTSAVFDVVRWVSYAGLALLGGAWLILTLWPAGRGDRRARPVVWVGWGAAVLGGLLELLLQGPYSAGTGLTKLVDPTLIDSTLHTDYGLLHSLRLLLLGALALVLARSLRAGARPARWEAIAGVLFVGTVVTFSAAGHPGTTSPAWLSITMDVLHLLSMAVWVGGLVLLVAAVLPRREPGELRAVLPVFSTVAFVAVAVLAASGTYAAFRGIGTVDAVFTTTYGLLVIAKVVLFCGLLTLGNLSRQLVRRRTVAFAMTDAAVLDEPAVVDDDEVATERLRRSVFVEALIAVVVLALSAVLVAEPRGKEALVASYRNPISASAALGGGRSVMVDADPGVHGQIDFTVELSSGSAKSVTATATEKQQQIGPIPLKLTRAGGAHFHGTATLPVAGRWLIELVVTTSAFDATTADVDLDFH